MKTHLLIIIGLFACGAFAAEDENYGTLTELCGEHAYKAMIGKLWDRNHGILQIGGPRVEVPWSGEQLHANVLIDATSLLDSMAQIDEQDLVKALNSNSAYWRVACPGLIWGRTNSVPSKSYPYVVATNRLPSDSELAEILRAWRKKR
jgi:hypothetical protein